MSDPTLDPLATVHTRIENLAEDVATNRQATDERLERVEDAVGDVKKNTDEIVEFFRAGKGAFTVLGWLGKIAKWVAAIGTAAGVLYAIVHGTTPKG